MLIAICLDGIWVAIEISIVNDFRIDWVSMYAGFNQQELVSIHSSFILSKGTVLDSASIPMHH